MHVYGNIIALDSKGKRGTAFLYKIGSQGQGHPQRIECYNNIAINSNYGFQFVTTPPSKIENNVTVHVLATAQVTDKVLPFDELMTA